MLSTLIPALFAGAILLYESVKRSPALLFATEDDDIKIAEGPFRHSPAAQDTAELAAQEFLNQKKNGNIDKARKLGEDFAKKLWELAQDLIMDPSAELTQQEIHHRLLLCSYSVNRVIAEYSPNSIAAQSALRRFYSQVEDRSAILHKHVSDTAAFSLYILSERSKDDITEIGKIYSKLIGRENNADKISEGNSVYSRFHSECADIISKVDFSL